MGSTSDRIGFIGLGLMGKPMANNLLTRGFAWSCTAAAADRSTSSSRPGRAAASTPAEVARQARRVITMLPDSPDVEAVLEGADGVFAAIQPGSLIVDSSSIAPAVARRLAARRGELGAAMLDAPVSGGEIGAINATLSIMVGGEAGGVRARCGRSSKRWATPSASSRSASRERASCARSATRW